MLIKSEVKYWRENGALSSRTWMRESERQPARRERITMRENTYVRMQVSNGENKEQHAIQIVLILQRCRLAVQTVLFSFSLLSSKI